MFRGLCRDAGKSIVPNAIFPGFRANEANSIVEYATREQAQQAVNTLSNQNLMGRLVYVREASTNVLSTKQHHVVDASQDREAEPRFTGPPAAGRGGFEGGRGGFGGGFGGGAMVGGGGGGGRQIYVSNVCFIPVF